MNSMGNTSISNSVKTLLIATIVVYIFQILPFPGNLFVQFGSLIPNQTFGDFQLWRLFTYMFLHDTALPFHILFNMLMLWMFGVEVENLWGARRFMIFYLICGAGSGLFSILHLFNPVLSSTPVIGASGAVLGVMTMYAYYFPQRQVLLFFVLPINIRVVVLGAALVSLFGSIAPHGIISHLTHLGGILVAICYIKLYPLILRISESTASVHSKRVIQQQKAKCTEDNKFFEEQIDPILAKISREGMDSLTKEERNLLKQASSRNRNRLKNGKIIPFDSFR
jgi:membrane associated rhomboid family serine protease